MRLFTSSRHRGVRAITQLGLAKHYGVAAEIDEAVERLHYRSTVSSSCLATGENRGQDVGRW